MKIKGLTAIQQTENGYHVLALRDKLAVARPGQKIDQPDFTDKIVGVGRNLTLDPGNSSVVYYCSTDNPRTISKLDTSTDPATWHTQTDLPQKYKEITNLQLDPSGNFFTFESGGEFVILSRDDLKEVKRIPKLWSARLDQQRGIRGVDEKGHLVIYDANFQEVAQELEKRRVTRLAQGLAVDLFKTEAEVAKAGVNQFQHLVPVKTNLETEFDTQLQAITALEDMSSISEALTRLRTRLQSKGLQPVQIEFITRGIQDSIAGKQRLLAAPVVAQGLVDLNTKLAGNLTIATITEAKGDIAKLKSLEGLVDDATRVQIRALENQFGQQSAELFRREGAAIGEDVDKMVGGVRAELEKMGNMPDFADWQEFRLPQLVSRLGSLANDCPLEAHETQKQILAARRQLQELSRQYETKFKERYALVREKASEIMSERVGLMKTDMDSLVDRLRARGFKDRSQAETYVKSSEALDAFRTEITELARQNPDAAKVLERDLKVKIAQVMGEIERGDLATIDQTGRQMAHFGDTLFPIWEPPVRGRGEKKVDLIFLPNPKSEGSGTPPDQIYGDVGLTVINSRGHLEKIRLFQGRENEDDWRLGSFAYRGSRIPPSFVTHGDYRTMIHKYADWVKGEKSSIRQEFEEKRQAVHQWYKQRQPIGQRDTHIDDQWGARYRELLADYAKFASENYVSIFRRIDKIKNAPESEYENGQGFPEEWQSSWVIDRTTEGYLKEMAQIFQMQLEQQSGILTLRGYPGSGKDVLMSMFSARTKRPYFSTDCTKWDTPYEFSEDIILESRDGASVTVRVPSALLNGITTGGALVYLNEVHALTEPAQIFLHALTDAKRRITLKTNEGKVVKVLPTVLLAASMNPGEKDPLEPALRDRMVFMDVDYPPLYREKDPADPNPNLPINASEALRIAREVKSLSDLTIEESIERNEFVKMWDKYINGIDNGASIPTPVQKFDLEAILALVQFANKLRENFVMSKSRKTQAASKALPVSIAATGRPLRDCAYDLSHIPDEQKTTANPEEIARKLLKKYFISKIDDAENREKIVTAMATWTSSKRIAA